MMILRVHCLLALQQLLLLLLLLQKHLLLEQHEYRTQAAPWVYYKRKGITQSMTTACCSNEL
jgi:hypothetical protein